MSTKVSRPPAHLPSAKRARTHAPAAPDDNDGMRLDDHSALYATQRLASAQRKRKSGVAAKQWADDLSALCASAVDVRVFGILGLGELLVPRRHRITAKLLRV